MSKEAKAALAALYRIAIDHCPPSENMTVLMLYTKLKSALEKKRKP